jgi:hypothetical protein
MLQIGDVLEGRYEIVGLLGEGGAGRTYEAQDLTLERVVAIKALSVRSLRDWKALELFEREARVLRDLDHPGIPTYIDAIKLEDQGGDAFCLVQEKVEGQHLGHRLAARRPIDEATCRGWAEQILHILIYLHERNPCTVHRDIKPHNLIERPDGRLALIDFGAVRDAARQQSSFASTVVGTYGYMAPEQLRGQASPAADLYGLGAALVALLTATDPAQLPHERLRIQFRALAQISDPLARWLERLLEPAPEDRPPSAREALRLLRDLDARLPNDTPLAAPAPRQGPAGIIDPLPERSHIALSPLQDGVRVKLYSPQAAALQAALAVACALAAGFLWVALHPLALLLPLVTLVFLIAARPLPQIQTQRLTLLDERLVLEDLFFGLPFRRVTAARREIQAVTAEQGGLQLALRDRLLPLGRHLSKDENRWLLAQLQRWRRGELLHLPSAEWRKLVKKLKRQERKRQELTLPPPPDPQTILQKQQTQRDRRKQRKQERHAQKQKARQHEAAAQQRRR